MTIGLLLSANSRKRRATIIRQSRARRALARFARKQTLHPITRAGPSGGRSVLDTLTFLRRIVLVRGFPFADMLARDVASDCFSYAR